MESLAHHYPNQLCEFVLLSLSHFPSVCVGSCLPSLHLLLHFVGVHVHSGGHLHRLAAAPAHILEEAEVSTARHDDCDDDDDGGAEGWRHGVFQDRLEASQADPSRALDEQAVVGLAGLT